MIPDLSFQDVRLIQIPIYQDNYVYALHDDVQDVTAVIDPGDGEPVIEALEQEGWRADTILVTHHHWDHVNGIEAVKQHFDSVVVGYLYDAKRIPHIDVKLEEGERVTVGRFQSEVMFIPGHTLTHIAYYFPELKLLFSGDTLFSLGCGRLFEGTAGQMMTSLARLMALPDDTVVCCTHEYTETNVAFAKTIDPHNPHVLEREDEVARLRAKSQPTVPMLLGEEKKANPFLRWRDSTIQESLNLLGEKDVEVFAEIRRRKDVF